MTTKLAVEFITTQYEFSHGKTPRGRGSWAFGTERNPDVTDRKKVLWSPSMTYGEAKRWATEEIRKREPGLNLIILYVLP